MKILIDMNLSSAWVDEFKIHNIEAVHWSNVGRHDASDSVLMGER
jgi:predicted nuclease of predicted toxin-antitoxin system